MQTTAERAIGVNLFKDRECPIFYGHRRKVDMVLLLLVGFLIRIVGRFGCDNLSFLSDYLWRLLPSHRSRWCL